MVKKGDTLIEVTIAVGIFSMVAISIVSVMSGGTSSAQAALETTLARQEIDTQAEALRFIHTSYISDKDNANDTISINDIETEDGTNRRFVNLWKEITDNAIDVSNLSAELATAILSFSPATCASLYNASSENSLFAQKAFVINPRALGDFTNGTVDKVYISSDAQPAKFSEASTFPRLVYSTAESGEETLANDNTTESLFHAEGIYVIAIKDTNTTNIVGSTSSMPVAAFYDFYIRTCWYGTDAKRPSTISTVVRLYNPDALEDDPGTI